MPSAELQYSAPVLASEMVNAARWLVVNAMRVGAFDGLLTASVSVTTRSSTVAVSVAGENAREAGTKTRGGRERGGGRRGMLPARPNPAPPPPQNSFWEGGGGRDRHRPA